MQKYVFRILSAFLIVVAGLWFFAQQLSAREYFSTQPPESPKSPTEHKPNGDGYEDMYKQTGRENASIVMLVRNRELHDALKSMREMEDRFNRRYHYPWTFLNDESFTEEFINLTRGVASGEAHYGLIQKEHWSVPSWIDVTKFHDKMKKMKDDNIIYGDSESYRHMCRFNSGFFFRHELLQKYRWYWRVEPGVKFFCDLSYDPFTFMKENNKIYGFVMAMYEYLATIPTLWGKTKQFIKENPQYLAANNSLDFFVDKHAPSRVGDKEITGDFNLCHFWSNFEIADMDFWRSEAYSKYFEFLDSEKGGEGGFFYERWGDAPVHSLGVGLFAPKSQIHHFADIGYDHNPYARCPQDDQSHFSGRCVCDRGHNFDTDGYSCQPRWHKVAGINFGAAFTKFE